MKQPIKPASSQATSRVSLSRREYGGHLSRGCAVLIAVALLLGMSGCAATGAAAHPLTMDQRVVIDGEVASVDLTPMAYDGDALVVVTSAAHGTVTVHLPARRNLCRAQGFDLLPELKPGDRVRVEGPVTGAADVTLCQDAADRLQRIE